MKKINIELNFIKPFCFFKKQVFELKYKKMVIYSFVFFQITKSEYYD